MNIRHLIFLGVVILASCDLPGSYLERPEKLVLFSWNVQNLFDDVRDGTEYAEFDPALGQWTSALFEQHLKNTLTVVNEVPEADILLFYELENDNVLKRIQKDLHENYAYRLLVRQGNQAIQVGILAKFPIVQSSVLEPGFAGSRALRHILEVHLMLADTRLILFLNHWKSRRGGVAQTEYARRKSANTLTKRIRTILAEQGASTEIIVSGDLNESHDEYHEVYGKYVTSLMPLGQSTPYDDQLFVSGDSKELGLVDNGVALFSPWYASEFPGSYYYDGGWETIDHFLLGPGLFDNEALEFEDFTVVNLPFLLSDEGAPKRWLSYANSGYSDHLPIKLTLKFHRDN